MSVNPKQATVTSTASRIDPNVDPMQRSRVVVRNRSTVVVYIGGPGVTTGTGFPLDPGDSVSVDLSAKESLYGIVASGTAAVAVLQSGGAQ